MCMTGRIRPRPHQTPPLSLENEISEIMGFVRIFWKNNVQEAHLPKMSISGKIVSEMLAGYTQKKTPYKPF